MPLPLTVSCFSKIQIGFTFLVPAYLGSPGRRAVKRVCVCKYPDKQKRNKNELGEVPGEERKPANDKCADDNAECPCGLVVTLLQHNRDSTFLTTTFQPLHQDWFPVFQTAVSNSLSPSLVLQWLNNVLILVGRNFSQSLRPCVHDAVDCAVTFDLRWPWHGSLTFDKLDSDLRPSMTLTTDLWPSTSRRVWPESVVSLLFTAMYFT